MENIRNPSDLFLRLPSFVLPLPCENPVLCLSWSSGPVPTGKVGHRLDCATVMTAPSS